MLGWNIVFAVYADTLSPNESSVQKQIPNCVQENQEKTVFKVKPSYSVTSRDIHADLLQCCVSVPRVPALWMVGDWLHFVSHAVLEGSQNRPPTPITWGILHKLKLCARRSLSQPMRVFFFLWLLILRWGVEGGAGSVGTSWRCVCMPLYIDFFSRASH